jgi:ectoine hydroxylase-related dioxygenase (phytanoyl-CoA dioxygenase family)
MEWSEQIALSGFATQSNVLPDELNEALDADIQKSSLASRAGLRHAMIFGAVRFIAHYRPIKQLACDVLGPQAFPFRATIFDKSPDANWLVVWHQDTALPLRHRAELPGWGPWSIKQGIPYAHAPAEVLSQILALRVHLDDSTKDNGPLRVLPGTHNSGVLDDDSIHNLAQSVVPVECVIPRGGVVAMRPLLIHSSSKSQSKIPRRVLHIEYAATDSIASPLELAIA